MTLLESAKGMLELMYRLKEPSYFGLLVFPSEPAIEAWEQQHVPILVAFGAKKNPARRLIVFPSGATLKLMRIAIEADLEELSGLPIKEWDAVGIVSAETTRVLNFLVR